MERAELAINFIASFSPLTPVGSPYIPQSPAIESEDVGGAAHSRSNSSPSPAASQIHTPPNRPLLPLLSLPGRGISASLPGEDERQDNSPLWCEDRELHSAIVQLLLQLLVTPEGAFNDEAVDVCKGARLPPLEQVLSRHFAGPSGAVVLPDVVHSLNHRLTQASSERNDGESSQESGDRTAQAQQLHGMLQLLRLLTQQPMDCKYTILQSLARGGYGEVYSARQQKPDAEVGQEVAVKRIQMPSDSNDSVLPKLFAEVSILAKYALQPLPLLPGAQEAQAEAQAAMAKPDPRMCGLLDFGLVKDEFWLVMPRYSCSLAEWRAFPEQQPPSQPGAAALYLAVLIEVVKTLQVLAADLIGHFDVKPANVLVELLPGASDAQLHSGPSAPLFQPCFRPVLADFGEARGYDSTGEAFTARNRGTEAYKSPEMLRMHAGGPPVGLASDVWSFGCAAYELLSGSMLFRGTDYASTTHRVVVEKGDHVRLTAQERAALGWPGEQLGNFVEWLLARDPAKRPTWEQVLKRLQKLREEALLRC